MIQPILKKYYQELQQRVIILLQNLDGEQNSLATDFGQLVEFWQEMMKDLQENEQYREILPQSMETEIHRLMKLLQMDMQFLQVSRQLTTVETRKEMIRDRANSLIRYCEAVLSAIDSINE